MSLHINGLRVLKTTIIKMHALREVGLRFSMDDIAIGFNASIEVSVSRKAH
ncbi:MAG: hypothetical protein PHR94_00250 [Methylomonas lenta]|nr:hypothetical protein [Methylomonas lenta]